MFDKSITDSLVKSVTSSVKFDKVSDLTKEQFNEILSSTFYEFLTNKDCVEEILKQSKAINDLRKRGL